MKPGDWVKHAIFGRGEVESLVVGGRARVRFLSAPTLPRTVGRQNLELEVAAGAVESDATLDAPILVGPWQKEVKPHAKRSAPKRSKVVEPSGVSAPAVAAVDSGATSYDRVDLRQAIEAMRMGVVPSRFVADYTVGRDVEIEALRGLLHARRGFRAIFGDYGAGKTHLLDLAESLAREQGFATSRIVIDPVELPPTHPKGIYRAIVQGLRLPGRPTRKEDSQGAGVSSTAAGFGGIDELAAIVSESEPHRAPGGTAFSEFLSPYLHVLHAQDPDAVSKLQDYVAGEDVDRADLVRVLRQTNWSGRIPLTLSDFRTYGRLYMLLLGTIAAWLEDAGYKGLVLLLDEVEHIDRMDRTELRYAVEVLKHFAAIALPRTGLAFDPEDPAELYRGGHEVHRDLPLQFRADQPLAVVCALTPLPDIEWLYRGVVVDPAASLRLRRLSARDRDLLFDRVESLYTIAYPEFRWTSTERTAARTRVKKSTDDDAGTVRRSVQRAVLVMDEHRYRDRSWNGA